MDDADLKRRWAQVMQAPATPHVSEEAWERLLAGESTDAERAAAFEHRSECAECAATSRELEALRTEALAFDPGVPAGGALPTGGPPFALRWSTLALAASLALATLVGLRLRLPAAVSSPPAPSREDPLRSAGHVPRLLEPLGRLEQAPPAFRWEATGSPRTYRVELLSADGRTLWTSAEVAGASVAWPSDLRLDPGRYYWRVRGAPRPGAPASESVLSTLAQVEIAR